MEIILVLSDEKGKNVLFVLDNLRALALTEAIALVKKEKVSGVHLVEGPTGTYLRANPNAKKEDNLDLISTPLSSLTQISMKEKTALAVSKYSRCRRQFLKEREAAGEKVIYVDGKRKKTEREIIDYLSIYKKYILAAARDLKVDKYLLGAILIDEDLRRDWQDDLGDWLVILGRNTTVGVAQVQVETARDLIKRNFYNPNPKDRRIAPSNISKTPRRDLYKYLDNPKHSIYFAAGKINQIRNDFSSKFEVDKPEIIGDLYSGTTPLSLSQATKRGKQIATELYLIARKVLR